MAKQTEMSNNIRGQPMRQTTHLVLDTTCLHLITEDLRACFLSLGLVDKLHQNTLVLEDVTLRFLIKLMIPVTSRIEY